MKCFFITIDTEEDQWSNYKKGGHSLKNIEQIPELQLLFDEFNIKPTYLISYPVATDRRSKEILLKIKNDNKAEIGAHCHPWNTPPFKEELSARNSMLFNLDAELQRDKLITLTETIKKEYNITPRSFRTGRWGYGPVIAKTLIELDYYVESSITPYMDWSKFYGPNYKSPPVNPYFFDELDILKENESGKLLEVPVTIGYSHKNFRPQHIIYEFFSKNKFSKKVLLGVASKLRLLRKIWLSPEISDARDMINLTNIYAKLGIGSINIMFHSNSLLPGLTPFVRDEHDKFFFIEQLRVLFQYLKLNNYQSKTLSEYYQEIKQNVGN